MSVSLSFSLSRYPSLSRRYLGNNGFRKFVVSFWMYGPTLSRRSWNVAGSILRYDELFPSSLRTSSIKWWYYPNVPWRHLLSQYNNINLTASIFRSKHKRGVEEGESTLSPHVPFHSPPFPTFFLMGERGWKADPLCLHLKVVCKFQLFKR